MAVESRVPTSEPTPPGKASGGWSLETTIDYLLAVMNEKHDHILSLIHGNDRRYEQRYDASQKALEAALMAQKEAINAALAAQDRAVTKAELATEKRFESVNEFRGTLDNQQRTLIPRQEVDVLIKGVDEKIGNLTKQVDQLLARQRERAAEGAGMKGGWGLAVGVVGFVLTFMSLVLLVLRFFGQP